MRTETLRRWLIYGCVIGCVAVLGLLAASLVRGALREHYRIDRQLVFRQVGLVLRMYVQESGDDFFPPLRTTPGGLLFGVDEAVPEELTAEYSKLLLRDSGVGPSQTAEVLESAVPIENDFFYLGYAITSEEEMAAFAAAYRERLADGGDFTEDLPVAAGTGTWGGDAILRLSTETVYAPQGSELYQGKGDPYTSERRSSVPLTIEKPGHYHVSGAYVLYADGYSEFIDYPGKWPMTEATINLLLELEAMPVKMAVKGTQ